MDYDLTREKVTSLKQKMLRQRGLIEDLEWSLFLTDLKIRDKIVKSADVTHLNKYRAVRGVNGKIKALILKDGTEMLIRCRQYTDKANDFNVITKNKGAYGLSNWEVK